MYLLAIKLGYTHLEELEFDFVTVAITLESQIMPGSQFSMIRLVTAYHQPVFCPLYSPRDNSPDLDPLARHCMRYIR